MKKVLILLAVLLMALGASACLESDIPDNSDDGNPPPPDPELGDFDQSQCKDDVFGDGERKDGGYKDPADSGEAYPMSNPIEAVIHGDSVTIIHHDAYYTCNARMVFGLATHGSDLILTEINISNEYTDCMCYMDLTTEIINLVEGRTYHIEVWDEYHDILFGEIDVTVGECPPTCRTARDCYDLNLPHPECEGRFTCVDNLCEWYCENWSCTSDSDCPAGYECVFYDWYGEDGNSDSGSAPTVPTDAACISDADCPEGMWCELVDCGDESDCYPGGFCIGGEVPPHPVDGVCEPVGMECETDMDCYGTEPWDDPLAGDRCPGEWACVNNYCIWECEWEGCYDNSDCPPGYHCEFYGYPGDPEGGGVDENGEPTDPTFWEGGVCEPDSWECFSDQDCPEGYHCEFYDYPGTDENGGSTDPDTGNPTEPPFWEGGVCEPNGMECSTDQDCYLLDGQNPSPDGSGVMEGFFECIDGMCVWQCGWLTCASDSDCGPGAYCEYYEECYGDGYCCEYSVCVQDEPPVCSNDRECYELHGGPPLINCLGAYWECVDGECEARCGEGCLSDDDCPDGFFCDNFQDPNGYGVCVERHQGDCMDDSDCPEGFSCNILCGNGWCYGSCEALRCESDADCYELNGGPPLIYCLGAYWECVFGECEARCGGECSSDADCPPEFYCDSCPPDPSCPECTVCGPPVCVPTNNNEMCYSSQDCGPNGTCSVDNGACFPPPGCEDGSIDCPTVCMGFCCGPVAMPDCQPGYELRRELDERFCEVFECAPADPCEIRDDAGRCLCGGFAGFSCPDGMECVFDDPNCNPEYGGADCMGHCIVPDCYCPMIFEPVCGMDGVTYGNPCFAYCAGVLIAYEGECENLCPPVAVPVCEPGFDLFCTTDSNGCETCECVFAGGECMSSEDCGPGEFCTTETGDCLPAPGCNPDEGCLGPPVCFGLCKPRESCECYELYAPVCGSDGVTYSNDCFAECAGVEIVHYGPCAECGVDADCPDGFFCNTCPPDPTCPICGICGPAVCEPGEDTPNDCEIIGGECVGYNPGGACPEGSYAIESLLPMCDFGGMCCVPYEDENRACEADSDCPAGQLCAIPPCYYWTDECPEEGVCVSQ